VIDPEPNNKLPTPLPAEPMEMASAWLTEATKRAVAPNPNAMTLATATTDGAVSARVVLCKQMCTDPGYLVFYTNYQSRKGAELLANPKAASVFHWDTLGRQLRIEGTVVMSPPDESDRYFASRDWGSQLGAWGSDQSKPIDSRDALIAQVRSRGRELGLDLTDDTQSIANDPAPEIRRPPHWGGFRLWASVVELWIEGADRVHDRAVWSRTLEVGPDNDVVCGSWSVTRRQP